jgi:thermostable 8-oxoguanine DNA glycosylase
MYRSFYMIDPFKITDFERKEADLQEFLLFCVAVAGKKATMIASKIATFLSGANNNELPFDYVRRLAQSELLVERLKDVKMGKYALLNRAWRDLTGANGPDIRACSADELQSIHGVGFKTARFFILHSRRDADVAVIDTHVLKYLASLGHKVPTTIPVGQQYLDLEAIMIELAKAAGMTMADFDLAVWSHYASQGQHPLPTIQKQAA